MSSHPHFKAYIALFSVYFFWGTTYLGIRMALESFPPLTLISARFIASGIIMLAVLKLWGEKIPRGRELWLTALYGVVILGGGNGCLVYAEQWIPSGTAALFITTSPFWMVGLEAVLPGGDRLHLPTMAGIVIGFTGVLILIAPAAMNSPAGPELLKGFLVLQMGCLCWCLGSLLQRRQPTKAHPFVSGAVQQLATGLAFLPLALLVPQHAISWNARGLWAIAYLVVFGSIVGYSAFVYILEHLPVPIVSTYTYVNPVVAVFLGWLFYKEPFGTREMIAMAAVFIGVAIVKYFAMTTPSARRVAA